jgi:hypothetical protein
MAGPFSETSELPSGARGEFGWFSRTALVGRFADCASGQWHPSWVLPDTKHIPNTISRKSKGEIRNLSANTIESQLLNSEL